MRAPLLAGLFLAFGGSADAQQPTRTEFLARLLAAEDRREYDAGLVAAALASGDALVIRQATLTAGRIRDPRAGPVLLAQLAASDTTAHVDAAFALGLLGDSTLGAALVARLHDPAPLALGAASEAAGALARSGGSAARAFVLAALSGEDHGLHIDRLAALLPGLLREGWRFGAGAPVSEATRYLTDSRDSVRWAAAYLLGRTRASTGTRALLTTVRDQHPWVRQFALRGLVRAAADSAGLRLEAILPALRDALGDDDPGVRVNALQSLATWGDSTTTEDILQLLGDSVPNVRLEAATTLTALRGQRAAGLVQSLAADSSLPLVLRRAVLLGLLRRDTATAVRHAAALANAPGTGHRLLAIEMAAQARPADLAPWRRLLHDPDPQVAAAALNALGALGAAFEAEIDTLARERRHDPNPRLRSAACTVLARRAAGAEAVPLLVEGWIAESTRGSGGAAGALLAALRRLHVGGGESALAVEERFLAETPPPPSFLLRRAAANWPALAARWGGADHPEVRYDAAGYRALVERFLLPSGQARPRVRIETEERGTVDLELLGDHAPLTVDNFLGLVESGFYDGGEWHRVIPNFVVQDGAGGPTAGRPPLQPIRDEINPVRYAGPVLGMALSGPDTGTSQWFINLSPQPHLDGGYTVFGRVIAGEPRLLQVLQGDRIRRIFLLGRP